MRGHNPRVTIIDDDPAVLRALARLFSVHGFNPTAYNSGGDFLNSTDKESADCLILDLHMPTISGLELYRELRRTGTDVPTIIITAHDEPGTRQRCRAAGVMAYLLKPCDWTVLFDAVKSAIELRSNSGREQPPGISNNASALKDQRRKLVLAAYQPSFATAT